MTDFERKFKEARARADGLPGQDDSGPVPRSDAKNKQRQERNGRQTDQPRPPAFTDESLALDFATQHADNLRYVATWSKWLLWDGKCWQFDDTLRAFDFAREICREKAAACNKSKIAVALASAKTVAAVERLAKVDRRIAATTEQWDADPCLLNTPTGVINLRSGDRRETRCTDYFTKMTAVGPGGECPTWHRFLDRVTANDGKLKDFLMRVAGYALTGITREHALFFMYGLGANGKSVFINTISGILGDYHRAAAIETFTASSVDRHPTDLAGLRGARLVTAVETEEGRRWAESRIKSLTGGDRIAARFMRQDFFEFAPQFKLLIAGNHKPGLRSVDEAIRRRLHLIPFTVTIPAAERDDKLADKLRNEWPGILAWMIKGCVEWQKTGLQPPDSVKAATATYLEAQDSVAAWLDECCDRQAGAWESRTALFESWSRWATAAGEYVGTRPRLLDALEARGLEPHRRTEGRGFTGLSIKRATTEEPYWNR
jgi:putative DNA primase/helicase